MADLKVWYAVGLIVTGFPMLHKYLGYVNLGPEPGATF